MTYALVWFAEYQPFTPIIETLRGLLTGTPIGDNAVIVLGGYLWSRILFNREPTQ